MRSEGILLIWTSVASAVYVLQDDYTAANFADRFDFFTGDDPTHGYVDYIDRKAAEASSLYRVEGDKVFVGVDSTNTASGRGRQSIRLESTQRYLHGLFLLDLAHMPGGQCGSWPAFWLLGDNWPNGGEIDVIEGVNIQTANTMTLHTSPGCSIMDTGQFTSRLNYANCDVYAPDQPSNSGCSLASSNGNSYGSGFNALGGGTYAVEWTSDGITIWLFSRSSIPADIGAGVPEPARWGKPMAQFSGSCDFDRYFAPQRLIFDVTFCGDWAGSVWFNDAVCSGRAATCSDFVRWNPNAFRETYWLINSLRVFRQDGTMPSSASVSDPTKGPSMLSSESVSATAPTSSSSSLQTTISETSLSSSDGSSTLVIASPASTMFSDSQNDASISSPGTSASTIGTRTFVPTALPVPALTTITVSSVEDASSSSTFGPLLATTTITSLANITSTTATFPMEESSRPFGTTNDPATTEAHQPVDSITTSPTIQSDLSAAGPWTSFPMPPLITNTAITDEISLSTTDKSQTLNDANTAVSLDTSSSVVAVGSTLEGFSDTSTFEPVTNIPSTGPQNGDNPSSTPMHSTNDTAISTLVTSGHPSLRITVTQSIVPTSSLQPNISGTPVRSASPVISANLTIEIITVTFTMSSWTTITTKTYTRYTIPAPTASTSIVSNVNRMLTITRTRTHFTKVYVTVKKGSNVKSSTSTD